MRAAPRPTPSLEISHTVSGVTRSARFEFLDGEEISHGDLIVRLTVHAAQIDYFRVILRETTTNTKNFLGLTFTGQSSVSVNDANGFAGNLATCSTNVDHHLRIEYHMDRGTHDIERDGLPILSERNHGVTGRGIGALLVGTDSATDAGSLFYIDNIRVLRGDRTFAEV